MKYTEEDIVKGMSFYYNDTRYVINIVNGEINLICGYTERYDRDVTFSFKEILIHMNSGAFYNINLPPKKKKKSKSKFGLTI